MSGENPPAVPRNPINTPWMMDRLSSPGAWAAATKPRPSVTEPMASGTRTPNRSDTLPITTPPMPKPIMVSV